MTSIGCGLYLPGPRFNSLCLYFAEPQPLHYLVQPLFLAKHECLGWGVKPISLYTQTILLYFWYIYIRVVISQCNPVPRCLRFNHFLSSSSGSLVDLLTGLWAVWGAPFSSWNRHSYGKLAYPVIDHFSYLLPSYPSKCSSPRLNQAIGTKDI